MPLNKDIKKVLVIGSGPIVIGQAAEFDYAGTQACRALREDGVEIVLVNSNPATIMTDSVMARILLPKPFMSSPLCFTRKRTFRVSGISTVRLSAYAYNLTGFVPL